MTPEEQTAFQEWLKLGSSNLEECWKAAYNSGIDSVDRRHRDTGPYLLHTYRIEGSVAFLVGVKDVADIIREAIAAERDECAKAVDALIHIDGSWLFNEGLSHAIAAIRARGKTE